MGQEDKGLGQAGRGAEGGAKGGAEGGLVETSAPHEINIGEGRQRSKEVRKDPAHFIARSAGEIFPKARVLWEPGKLVSHSEMTSFRRCAREWHYRYRERIEPLIPADALVRGRKIHEALAHWWDRRSSAPPKLRELGADEMGAADRAMLRGYSAYWEAPSLYAVQVNVPISVELDGVTVVGECDAVGRECVGAAPDADSDPWVVVEHKTTSADISPGSSYWRQVVTTAMQPSIYLLAYPEATVLWDALRKPALRQLERSSKRPEPESSEDFEARMVAQMAEDPARFFQRAKVVRLEEETLETVLDIQTTADAMRNAPINTARNPDACWGFGRACDFFGLCWDGRTVRDSGDTLVRADDNHTAIVASRGAA